MEAIFVSGIPFFLLVICSAEGINILCPNSYLRYENTCYKYYQQELSWDDAAQVCIREGQELISWQDDSDGKFFSKIASGKGKNVWVGMRRDVTRYVWMNGGEQYLGSLWANQQPSFDHGEDCVHFFPNEDGLNDDKCYHAKPFICKACSYIEHCLRLQPCQMEGQPCQVKGHVCQLGGPSSVTECMTCDLFYKPSRDSRTCDRKCEYDNPCWPGTCHDEYRDQCNCADGFTKRVINGKTTCQPTTQKPSIDSCFTTMLIPNGKKATAISNNTKMECAYMQDFYGNFQPELIDFDITASFDVEIDSFPSKPTFIAKDMKFGVTDVTVTITSQSPGGATRRNGATKMLLHDVTHGTNAKQPFIITDGNLTATKGLNDGDTLCLHIDVKGGGYYTTQDLRTHTHHHYEYDKVTQTRDICYIMDTTKPESTAVGDTDPFYVDTKITRSGNIHVEFNNWIDPIPTNGDKTLASGIENYVVSVYEMNIAETLFMGTSILGTKTVNASADPRTEFHFNSTTPTLMCLYLEVKDAADNVRFARRFILYDNTSFLEVDKSNAFTVTSASPTAYYNWQTHHNDICISWNGYFVNKFYQDNHVLNPIKYNPEISGKYGQTTGDIPVSGTPNVNGIIAFNFSWSNASSINNEGAVPQFLNQTHCKSFNLKDGQTYTLNITAIDIVNNTFTDSRTVSIDRSVPHIHNIWLLNNGYESLFAHGDKDGDLTEIDLSFEVLDPHSGIEEIEWAFGISDHGMELMAKNISINETETCDNTTHCICPAVGKCQITKYIVSLKGNVLKQGNHNRNYYFTIKATNKARLYNIEHMEILVDTSPPVTGVVFEGPLGGKDLDYTSKPDFMVNWHGFIDHESGIKLYRVALANRCLSQDEMNIGNETSSFIVEFHEVPSTEMSVRLTANFTGQYFVTVVALNNAAELSEPACSDGIARDETAPAFNNISLLSGRWKETVHCNDGHVWLLHSSMERVRLAKIDACTDLCSNGTTAELPTLLIERKVNSSEEDIADFICKHYDLYDNQQFIYLPNDHIEVSWDMSEEDSQINEFHVGFGSDGSTSVSPDLMAYASTNRRTFYRRNHAGFSFDDPFYMFIKAGNKAGLETTVVFGPIIIDETPPVEMNKAIVSIDGSHLTVGWENNSFVDPEQEDPISSIMFQFDSNDSPVTPLLEWNRHMSVSCPVKFTGGCIIYPLDRLQSKDTRDGRHFSVVLYVYNNAGHMLRSTTESFKIPSKYPPGHGSVMDTDPSDVDQTSDVSGHTTEHTLCSRWSGFDHHENVSIEIGVGSSPGKDDVYPFRHVPNNGSVCLHAVQFLTNVRYFTTIRSTCSGGTTLSSSNGVTIINETEILNSLVVHTGQDCKNVPEYKIQKLKMSDLLNGTFSLNTRFRVGQLYYIQATQNGSVNEVNFETPGGLVDVFETYWYTIIPFTDRPLFRFTNGLNTSLEFTFNAWECKNGSYLYNPLVLHGHWKLGLNINTNIRYEVAVGIACQHNKARDDCVKIETPFHKASSNNSASIRIDNLSKDNKYRLLVRPCVESRCLRYAMSDDVTSVSSLRDLDVFEANITTANSIAKHPSNCTHVDIKWKIKESHDQITFFQWGISKDSTATTLLTIWSTSSSDGNIYNLRSCVIIPAFHRETLYACVRVFTWSSLTQKKCIQMKTDPTSEVTHNRIYEFDSSQSIWPEIKQLLNSRFLGDKLTQLHDSELDFGNEATVVTGAMSMVSERNVTWFLMSSNYAPVICSGTSDCIMSVDTSSSNYVNFKQDDIQRNRIMYICAYSESTTIRRENHDDNLSEINSCSDGFVIDTFNPSRGHIVVPNHNNYITDIRNTIVHWDNFTDNVDVEQLGYTDQIKYYTISAGTNLGGDDLHTREKIGDEHTFVFDNIRVLDGTNVYITLTGTDQAGLHTSVTSDVMVIDSSEPSVGHIEFDHGNYFAKSAISSDQLTVYLSGFEDPHSGIDYFKIGVGSRSDVYDIVPVREITSNHETFSMSTTNFIDGKQYYVNAQAVNRAGLQSSVISRTFVVDRTPPAGGHVLDGLAENNGDLDYQDNDTYIAGHWYGFNDHHSGISHYRVGLGSRPFLDDEETFVNVGLRTNMIWKKSFTQGTKYSITVEACNKARLCTQTSSDGIILDTSGPIAGIVRVGHSDKHGKFQAKSSSLHMQWVGFSDPESGLDHFEACIGSAPRSCDIHPYLNCLLSSSITKTGLSIPTSKHIYVTVKAMNGIGKTTVVSSDDFIIDKTAPELVEKPSIVVSYNHVQNNAFQYDPSVLRVRWKFTDAESPVVKHYVTLKTHHEGHSPIENVELGSIDRITFSLDQSDWLHNGDTYYVIVTSCNAAGMCTSAVSNDVTIDSTSPHQGGFTSDLRWRNIKGRGTEVTLSWHSFTDAESDIREFYITVSRRYSGSELSGGIVIAKYDNTFKIQQRKFNLTEDLQGDDRIYLTLWARNNAGLNSSISRISVNVILTSTGKSSYGILEIEKHSCQSQYCSGDCTCAVVGKPCEKSTCSSNNTRNSTVDLPHVNIFWGLPTMIQSITTSSACLSAHWDVTTYVNGTITDILRYEYSIGIQGDDYGTGIFSKDRVPWVDVGLGREVVHCLTDKMHLHLEENYVFYVRAWFGRDVFETFNSSSIIIDQTGPKVKRGASIIDSDISCMKDYDLIDWMNTITACWHNVFTESQGRIIHYTVAFGTAENADDVMVATTIGLNSTFRVTNLTMRHGTKYFFTVTAYNNVGLHTTLSSDGFVIDMDKPRKGVVFNTNRFRNAHVQSDSSTFALSWKGFTDGHTGIKAYFVALAETEDSNRTNMTFTYVGLKNQYIFTNLNLVHGRKYNGFVKAIDSAGHESDISVSHGKLIDTTKPTGFVCHSFEEVEHTTIFKSGDDAVSDYFEANFTEHRLYKVIGQINETRSEFEMFLTNGDYQLRLPTSRSHRGEEQFEYSFISSINGLHNISLEFRSKDTMTGSAALLGCNDTVLGDDDAVHVKQIGPNIIAVNVQVQDRESSIYKVHLGVGSTKGGFQVAPLQTISGGNNGILEIDAQHGTKLFVTAISENHAGLKATFYSKPIILDHTGPVLELHKTDIVVNGTDAKFGVNLGINWAVVDMESGVKQCYCSFGRLPGLEDLLTYTQAETSNSCLSNTLYLPHGAKVYGNIRCVNNVELKSEVTTEAITIVYQAPSANRSKVSFVQQPQSKSADTDTYGKSNGSHSHRFIQSRTDTLSFEWDGFVDKAGIDKYEYRITDIKKTIVEWTETKKSSATIPFHGNPLSAGQTYTAEVKAVNVKDLTSLTATADIYVDDREPGLRGQNVRVTRAGQTRVNLNWGDVFQKHPVFACSFDVTVGSRRGYADLLDLHNTVVMETEMTLPDTNFNADPIQELFIAVWCEYPTGTSRKYSYDYRADGLRK